MHIGIAGGGPAAEALRGAFSDVSAQISDASPESLNEYDLGVVVAPAGSDAFERVNAAASRWVAVEIGGVGGHPLPEVDASVSVFGHETGCYRCLRARVASNSETTADRPRGDRSAVRFAGALAGRRAVMLLSGEDVAGTVVEVPGPERRFLPVPGCDCDPGRSRSFDPTDGGVGASLDDAIARAERALDERVGVIRTVGERESFPVPYYLAQTADTTAFSDARAAEFAAGADADWDVAFMKALGEGLERYSAGVYRAASFTTAPETNVASTVSPRRFVRSDDYRPPDPEEPIAWTDGVDLATGGDVALPAEFVHFPPPRARHKPSITTGLGLGNSPVEAVLSGLYEVIERDATMLAWYSTFEPLELGVDGSARADAGDASEGSEGSAVEGYAALVKRARAENLSVTPLLVTQDVDVPVVAVAVHRDGEWPKFAMGSGADLDAVAAARSALAEALQNWMELRTMGADRAAEEEGAIGRYADFPREARRFVDAKGTVRASELGEIPTAGKSELRTVVERLSDVGLDAYAARITPRDVQSVGFEAVRVLVPEAQPLFTGDPFFGDRARTVPPELGFEPRLDYAYHPFP
jgi:ribosomal protein S12 methylthiotransferase accessory factor